VSEQTALKAGLVNAVQRNMYGVFGELAIEGGRTGFLSGGGEVEVATGFVVSENGVVITTDKSTYEVSVKRIGEDD